MGAGKTTTLGVLAEWFQSKGRKVGLITNDQAHGLVDTQILSTMDMEVQEISGSCFCCDFDGLMEAALFLREAKQCDLVIAEPVGSCTDLSATILKPVVAYYKKHFNLAPLSVLADPDRLITILSNEGEADNGSAYIYLKQLEEADHLVVNKKDLLTKSLEIELKQYLELRFPDYPIHWISAENKTGISDWLNKLLIDKNPGIRAIEVDYDKYADAEAKMGWYNAGFIVRHTERYLIPWAEFSVKLLQLLQEVFRHEQIVIGHIKTFINNCPSELHANLTGTERALSVKGQPFSSHTAKLILNIRAEAEPDLLKEIMEDTISIFSEELLNFETITLNYLKPGRPVPTHRLRA